MPTYRNDGKNVLLVERVDGVVVPVGPGESVETFKTITVEGFTQTAATPMPMEVKVSGDRIIAVANLVSIPWRQEIKLPANLTKHKFLIDYFLNGEGNNVYDIAEVYGKPFGSDSYILVEEFAPWFGHHHFFEGGFTHLIFGHEIDPSTGWTATIYYTGWN
jgi:hypothetical protein